MTLPGEDPRAREQRRSAGLGGLVAYLSRFDDGEVIRWAFRGLLIGAIGVVALDLRELMQHDDWDPAGVMSPSDPQPVLPPAVEIGTPTQSSNDPRPYVTTDEGDLAKPMTFTLQPGGRLQAQGTIVPGTAERFGAELSQRGEYVRVVSLNSPGGSLEDAMAMARLVRERGLGTEVADGALCASSCPLVMAGGKQRTAGPKAAVGVHQFYAASPTETGPAQVMADAQATTARISRHLQAMGVDPALWLHALDTPPRALYYLSAAELSEYRMVTGGRKSASKKSAKVD
jgi:hypothetical protein